MREQRVLQHLFTEINQALEGLPEQDQAWLLASLRAWCWRKLLQFDESTRSRAEWEATSPLRLLKRE